MRVAACLVAGLSLACAEAALARAPALSGSVSKKGYFVIALANNGRATGVLATRGKFKLVPPAQQVTLQLRDPRGRYAGPVVVGRKGRSVVLGVRAGAQLGRIVVKAGYGVARVPVRAIVRGRIAAASGGKPIGAGKLGLVRSLPSGASGLGLDPDRDGIPSAIDIDDDGDLVLDHVDRSPAGRGRVEAAALAPASAPVLWTLNVGLETSFLGGGGGYALNVNTSANPFVAQFTNFISQALDTRGVLLFPSTSGQPGLECQVTYCRFGKAADLTDAHRFPAEYQVAGTSWARIPPVAAFNPDREGIGTTSGLNPSQVFAIRPHADVFGISSADVYLIHYPATSQSSVLANASYIFTTVPALSAWGDGTHSQNVGYPLAFDGPGTQRSPIPLQRSASGHYLLTMTLWPPQGRPLNNFITLGGLEYTVVGRTNTAGTKRVFRCPVSAYSNPSAGTHIGSDGVVDDKPDRAVDRSDTLTFTADLTACLEASGLGTWGPGSPSVEVFVAALSATSDSSEGVGFAFKPADEGGSGGGGGSAPASGTWSFVGGTPGTNVNWTVNTAQAGVTKLDIQFHEATPVTSFSAPAGWTCTIVTTTQPSDTLECTDSNPSGEPAGTAVSGQASLTSAGTNGMPVTLTVTQGGATFTSDMHQG